MGTPVHEECCSMSESVFNSLFPWVHQYMKNAVACLRVFLSVFFSHRHIGVHVEYIGLEVQECHSVSQKCLCCYASQKQPNSVVEQVKQG